MPNLAAQDEMNRLRGARAWSPLARVKAKTRNQHVCRYTFDDGSKLSIYFNGDASWHSESYGEQRWRSWHFCNR